MKKTLSFLLAAALMATMAVPAFADDAKEVDVPGSDEHDVTATYREGEEDTDVETVYYVTVEWEIESDLTYYDGTTTYTWNAESTEYVAQEPTDDGWTGSAEVTITVTNKSNAAITASAVWAGESELTTSCDFADEEDSIEIASAAEDTDIDAGELEGAPVTGTITATVEVTDGTIDEDDAVVGTITVTIDKAAD